MPPAIPMQRRGRQQASKSKKSPPKRRTEPIQLGEDDIAQKQHATRRDEKGRSEQYGGMSHSYIRLDCAKSGGGEGSRVPMVRLECRRVPRLVLGSPRWNTRSDGRRTTPRRPEQTSTTILQEEA